MRDLTSTLAQFESLKAEEKQKILDVWPEQCLFLSFNGLWIQATTEDFGWPHEIIRIKKQEK